MTKNILSKAHKRFLLMMLMMMMMMMVGINCFCKMVDLQKVHHALLPSGLILRGSHHGKPPKNCEQDSNLWKD